MATWFDLPSIDLMLNDIKTNATKILLIQAYTQGDSYATVTGNEIGDADITSGDFSTISGSTDRTMTFNGKTGTASQTVLAGQALHLALTDGVSRVLAVTDETSRFAPLAA